MPRRNRFITLTAIGAICFQTRLDDPSWTETRVRVFGNGWYPANHLPPIARWMSGRSWLRFEAEGFSRIRLQLTTHIPELRTSPMELEFKLNGEHICGLCLFEYGWLDLEIDVAETITRGTSRNSNSISLQAAPGSHRWQIRTATTIVTSQSPSVIWRLVSRR